jgi:excisionase family DNA binding protein
VSAASTLARALVDALREAPEALAELRELLAVDVPAGDPWMDVREAAEYLRCKPQRIYDLKSQGRLAAGGDGSRPLFRRSTLDAYLAGRG